MRFSQVTSDGDWKFALELHPRVTLLTGLGDQRTAEMAELLEDIIRGQPRDIDAILELDGQSVAFEEWRQHANGEIGPVELVLRAGDLPGASRETAAAVAVQAARRALEQAEHALAEARQAATDAQRPLEAEEAATMRHALDQATDALAEAEAERDRLRGQIAAAKAAAASAARSAEEAGHAAEHAATDSEARRWANRRAEIAQRLRRVDEDLAKAAARHRELDAERQLLGARTGDASPVDAEAVDAVSQALDAIPAASDAGRETAARELLSRFEELETEAARPADLTAVPEWLVNSARQTLEEARLAAIKAEEAAKPVSISAADAADLERAQRDVVAAEERASRKLSGPRAQQRLDATNAVLQGVLDRIGVSSYSAYLLRAVNVGERTAPVEQLDKARRALADAEAVWDELRAGGAEGADRRRQVELEWRSDAASLLGVADEPDQDVATVAERVLRLADQRGRARAGLAETLGRLGIALGPGDDPELAASAWLGNQQTALDDGAGPSLDVDEQLAEIAAARSKLEAERSALQTQLDELRLSEGPAPSEPSRGGAQVGERVAQATARVDELEASAVQAEQRLEDAVMAQQIAEAAVFAVDGSQAPGAFNEASARLDAEVRVKQNEVDAARAAAERATAGDEGDQETQRPEASDADREIYVLARLAAVRAVGPFGALPLVMVDPFSGLDLEHTSKLHATLKRMSEVVQLIYFTDSPDALAWAEHLGQDWAAVRGPDSLVRHDPAAEPSGGDGRTVEVGKSRRGPHGFGHRRRRA